MPASGLNVWLLAARPKTLWAGIVPVLIGTAMAIEAGGFHPGAALAALFGSIMIQIGTNYANDYYDFVKGTDTTARIGPQRVTQSGLVSPGAMRTATAIVFALAFMAGVYLVWRAGWPIVIIGLASILFGLVYTGGPLPIGYVGLGDIFVLFFFGPVAVGGTYYAQTLHIEWPVIAAGFAPGLFSVAILTVNNLRDHDTDFAGGKRTLTVRLGRTFARWEYALSIVIASLLPAVIVLVTRSHYWSLAAIVTIPFALPGIRTAFTSTDGPVLNDLLATTGKLLLLFGLFFSAGWLL